METLSDLQVSKIVAEFGPRPIGSVGPSDVRTWLARLREVYAPRTVNSIYRTLVQVFSGAVHDGVIPKSPCSRRTSPGTVNQRPCVATTDQIWALHDTMPERLRVAILLGAFLGLRTAEACDLRVTDVDFMRGVASLLTTSGADVKVVQAQLRHASAVMTLDTYGHLWPDSDESTRAAVAALFQDRAPYVHSVDKS